MNFRLFCSSFIFFFSFDVPSDFKHKILLASVCPKRSSYYGFSYHFTCFIFFFVIWKSCLKYLYIFGCIVWQEQKSVSDFFFLDSRSVCVQTTEQSIEVYRALFVCCCFWKIIPIEPNYLRVQRSFLCFFFFFFFSPMLRISIVNLKKKRNQSKCDTHRNIANERQN